MFEMSTALETRQGAGAAAESRGPQADVALIYVPRGTVDTQEGKENSADSQANYSRMTVSKPCTNVCSLRRPSRKNGPKKGAAYTYHHPLPPGWPTICRPRCCRCRH